MSYYPAPEKLEALGFRLVPRPYGGFTAEMGGLSMKEWPMKGTLYMEVQAPIPSLGSTIVFFGECPSEAFFDQLLPAVGWQPNPETDQSND